jgi:hypothetical protein
VVNLLVRRTTVDAALRLGRSLMRQLAGRRLPVLAGVEVTAGRVTVVQDADTSVLVYRAETALVVLARDRTFSQRCAVGWVRPGRRTVGG